MASASRGGDRLDGSAPWEASRGATPGLAGNGLPNLARLREDARRQVDDQERLNARVAEAHRQAQEARVLGRLLRDETAARHRDLDAALTWLRKRPDALALEPAGRAPPRGRGPLA